MNHMKFCKEREISQEFSNPYTPEQNGVSGRLNRTLFEKVRSMIYHAKVPSEFLQKQLVLPFIWTI